MSEQPDPSAPHRDANNRFAPGNPGGPGRPPGARNRASQRLIMEILRDFELNRELVLFRLRFAHPQSYAALLKRVMPSPAEIDAADRAGEFDDIPLPGDDTEWRDKQGEKSVAAVRAALEREERMVAHRAVL